METNTDTEFFVMDSPGHYGDSDARVYSAHYDLQSAIRAAGYGYVVRKGGLTKGSQWYKADESKGIYPIVWRWSDIKR